MEMLSTITTTLAQLSLESTQTPESIERLKPLRDQLKRAGIPHVHHTEYESADLDDTTRATLREQTRKRIQEDQPIWVATIYKNPSGLQAATEVKVKFEDPTSVANGVYIKMFCAEDNVKEIVVYLKIRSGLNDIQAFENLLRSQFEGKYNYKILQVVESSQYEEILAQGEELYSQLESCKKGLPVKYVVDQIAAKLEGIELSGWVMTLDNQTSSAHSQPNPTLEELKQFIERDILTVPQFLTCSIQLKSVYHMNKGLICYITTGFKMPPSIDDELYFRLKNFHVKASVGRIPDKEGLKFFLELGEAAEGQRLARENAMK